jgi:hypothetical protein
MMIHSYVVNYDVLGEMRPNDVTRAIAFVKRTIAQLRAAGEERAERTFRVGRGGYSDSGLRRVRAEKKAITG